MTEQQPLAGLVVLDASEHVAGQACSRVLAGLGASTVLLEPPGGSRVRSLGRSSGGGSSYLFDYLNTGKRSVALSSDDPTSSGEFGSMIATADVLLLGAKHRLREEYPQLVTGRVLDFPSDTEISDWRSNELIQSALSGAMYASGDPSREPLYGLGLRTHQSTGWALATGVMSALIERQNSCIGQQVEVSVYETAAALSQNLVSQYDYSRTWPSRERYAGQLSMLRASDGWVVLFAGMNWPGTCAAVGRPELADDPRFSDPMARVSRWPEITVELQQGAARLRSQELVDACQARKVCAEQVLSVPELLENPYLIAPGQLPDELLELSTALRFIDA